MEPIPREAWFDVLNRFTVEHQGWPVLVNVLAPDRTVKPVVINLPLIGISADRFDHDGAIAISVARADGTHFTHVIHDVTGLFVDKTTNGGAASLRIESDGTTTLLRLVAAASTAGA